MPLVRVEIRRPDAAVRLLAERREPPPEHEFCNGFAVLDTGSSITSIDLRAVDRLALEPIGPEAFASPGTPDGRALAYMVRLALPWGTDAPRLLSSFKVLAHDLQSQGGITAIIGRDALQGTVLTYDGVGHTFRWEYESCLLV